VNKKNSTKRGGTYKTWERKNSQSGEKWAKKEPPPSRRVWEHKCSRDKTFNPGDFPSKKEIKPF